MCAAAIVLQCVDIIDYGKGIFFEPWYFKLWDDDLHFVQTFTYKKIMVDYTHDMCTTSMMCIRIISMGND